MAHDRANSPSAAGGPVTQSGGGRPEADRDNSQERRLTVEQLKDGVVRLTIDERARFHEWLDAWHDDDDWDRQMEDDARSGRLDAWLAEVDREIAEGKTEPLPETPEECRKWRRDAARQRREEREASRRRSAASATANA